MTFWITYSLICYMHYSLFLHKLHFIRPRYDAYSVNFEVFKTFKVTCYTVRSI